MFPGHLKKDDIVVEEDCYSRIMILQYLGEKKFEAYCVWFDNNKKRHGGWFKTSSLKNLETVIAAELYPGSKV